MEGGGGSFVGRRAAWGWIEMHEPGGETPSPVEGWALGKEKRQAGPPSSSTSPSGPSEAPREIREH